MGEEYQNNNFFDDQNQEEQTNGNETKEELFDDNMFLIFSTGILMIIILIWLIQFFKRRNKKDEAFPCHCSKCEEKRRKLESKRKTITTSHKIQFVIMGIFVAIIFRNIFTAQTIEAANPTKTFNPYEILGVSVFSDKKEIRSAYRKLSLKYHPDKNKEEGAEEMYLSISKAYEILNDPEKLRIWQQTGGDSEQHVEKIGIGLPKFLTEKKNKKIVLFVYLGLIAFALPAGVLCFLRKTSKIDNNNLNVETNALFFKLIETNLSFGTFIEVLSLSEEIRSNVVLNEQDEEYLPAIQKKINEEYTKKPTYNVPEAIKAQILIGAHLSRLHDELPEYLKEDLDKIVNVCPSVLHGMVSVMMGKKNLNALFQCIRLNAMITQACTIETEHLQLPGVQDTIASVFGKNMTMEKLMKMNQEDRIALINEKVVKVPEVKKHAHIAKVTKTPKSVSKKQSEEKTKYMLKKRLNEEAKKQGKEVKFKDVEMKEQEKKEMKKEDEKNHEIENTNESENEEQLQEYRDQLITWFAYHPSNIEFIVKAIGVNGTRTVVAGVPILVNINAYRYPRDEQGLLSEERKKRIEDLLEENKKELPEESRDSRVLLERPKINEDEEEEIDENGEVGNIETINKSNQDVFVHNPYCSQSRLERWWFIVTDVKNQVVINAANGYIPISDLPFIAKIYLPSPTQEGTFSVNLHIICDSYLRCEYHMPITFNCVENTIGQEVEENEKEEEHDEENSEEESEE